MKTAARSLEKGWWLWAIGALWRVVSTVSALFFVFGFCLPFAFRVADKLTRGELSRGKEADAKEKMSASSLYEALKPGMSEATVQKIAGKPSRQLYNQSNGVHELTTLRYERGHTTVDVNFVWRRSENKDGGTLAVQDYFSESVA